MAGSYNRVILMGNLTRDPELRSLPSGAQVVQLGLAVNDRVQNKDTQQWEDRANFIDCVGFGKTADSIARFFTKGKSIFIEGRLRWSSWDDRETGKKRSKLEVAIDSWQFCESRGDGGQQQGSYTGSGRSASQVGQQTGPPPSMSIPDDEIPFS